MRLSTKMWWEYREQAVAGKSLGNIRKSLLEKEGVLLAKGEASQDKNHLVRACDHRFPGVL